MNTTWVSLRPATEFLSYDATVEKLNDFFGSDGQNTEVPAAIIEMMEQRQELAIEALGGMMFYLQSLNMANDLLSQKSFNIYDPIRKGEGMVLDGQTLSHLEVNQNLGERFCNRLTDATATGDRSCSTTKAAMRVPSCSCCKDASPRLAKDCFAFG